MDDQKKTGFNHLIHAIGWSVAGFTVTLKEEAAFRQELFIFVFLSPLAFWLGETATEIILMIGSLLLVLIVELINTGIEAAIDRISDARHPLSKKAKDVGSAAVMLAIFNVAFVWGMILYGLAAQ